MLSFSSMNLSRLPSAFLKLKSKRDCVRFFTTVPESSSADTEFKVNSFYDHHKEFHIPTTSFQRMALFCGSMAVCLLDPKRADLIAVGGETAGEESLKYMYQKMLSSSEGKAILRDKPRINTNTVDIEKLKSLPDYTLGNMYYKFLEKNDVSPDSRLPVQFVDDVELAYVMQRYREVHDLFHTILKQPTHMLGEVTVKWVEAIQLRLPMCFGAAIFGAMRLAPKQRLKYVEHNLPWAIKTGFSSEFLLNIYFEKRWEQPIEHIYNEFKFSPLK